LKQLLLIFICLACLVQLQGQRQTVVLNEPNHDDRPIHFGFCLGLNMMDFIVRTNYNAYHKYNLIADVSKPTPGFHILVVSNFRLGEYFDFRFLPGVSFGQRTLNFFDNKDSLINSNHKLESNFLEFPFMLKYKAKRLNNFRPYLVTGTNLRVDLAKTLSEDDGVYIALKRLDLYYEVGAGIDFYMPYFKFSTELKVSYGLNNVLRRRDNSHPQYQDVIDRLNSSVVMLSFFFE
jgi:hypothetical protein